MSFKSARCPNCSGVLSLDPTINKGFCMHCGSEIIVEDAIKKVKVDGVASAENLITMADNARIGGIYKEAYDYYTKALEIDPGNSHIMLNRALMAGMLAKLDNSKIDVFLNDVSIAINKAPDDEKNSLKIKASSDITEVAIHLFKTTGIRHVEFGEMSGYFMKDTDSFENPENYPGNNNTYEKMQVGFKIKIIKALDVASEYNPQNREANSRLISGLSSNYDRDPELLEFLSKKR